MFVPRSWLDEFVDTSNKTVDELTDAFNELGLVVEGVEAHGEGLDGIVTAQIKAIRKHPDADKIRLVDVVTAVDATETLQIACGAWNFFEGDVVPLATLGTTMPDGMKIERRKMRGEWSNGMLCSGRELKLSDDHAGIWRLPEGTPLGVPITVALGIAKDVVFDLSIEANRPDAMSILGVARDLAPKIGSTLKVLASKVALAQVAPASVNRGTITATDLCDRLTVTVIKNVTVTQSPLWVQSRLKLGGMRPINNLVDASNYVMLEYGIPSHAFDLDRLPGGCIDVRWARADELITTLDGVERTLSPSTLGVLDGIIADGNAIAVGIAAVMGGLTSEVGDDTENLLLEVAHWTPMCIARTSKRLKLRSEASARFERGTDREAIIASVSRIVEIIQETCPSLEVESFDDVRPLELAVNTVTVRTDRANLVLGTHLSTAEIAGYLFPIGFISAPTEDTGILSVTIPSWRPDAVGEIDVIEEVGRHHGYGNVDRQALTNSRVGTLTPYQKARRKTADLLVAKGCEEVWTSTFLSPADLSRSGLSTESVALANPMVAEESVLRTSLLPGMLRVLGHNADHRSPAMRLFEIGHTFNPPRPRQVVPYEREYLGVVLAANGDDATTAVTFVSALVATLRVKPEAVAIRSDEIAGLHPTRAARIVGSGTGFSVGMLGEVDPDVAREWGVDRRVGVVLIDLENFAALPRRAETIVSFSKFPSSDVDLAFAVSESTPAADVESALKLGAGELLQELSLFDVYRGDRIAAGSRGLTYRLRFAALDRTLTDADVVAVRQAAIDAVFKSTGSALRS